MTTVNDNSIQSINAALLNIKNSIPQAVEKTVVNNNETVIVRGSGSSGSSSAEVLQIRTSLKSLSEQVDELKNNENEIEAIKNQIDSLTRRLDNISLSVKNGATIAYTDQYGIETEDTIEAEAVVPHYLGSYESAPEDASEGDWYFNSTDKKLMKLENDAWSEVEYSEGTKYMYNEAANDLIQYASDNGNIGLYAAAFIQDLFANNIVITEGGSIKSSNYQQKTSGFKISANGEIEAATGIFYGKTGRVFTLAENVDLSNYDLDLTTYKDFLTHDRNNGFYESIDNGLENGVQRYTIYAHKRTPKGASAFFDTYILLADLTISQSSASYGGYETNLHYQTYENTVKATGNLSKYVTLKEHIKGDPENANTYPQYCYWLYGRLNGAAAQWYKNPTDTKIYLSKTEQELYIMEYITLNIKYNDTMDLIAIRQMLD